MNTYRSKFLDIASFLDENKVSYTILRRRDDSLMFSCVLIGARIEIDVFDDNHIEYSIFTGDEGVDSDEIKLRELIIENFKSDHT